MKNIILIVACASISVGLAGCVTKQNPAHTEVFVPGVGTIDHHCPPGQRKKGTCN